MHCTIPNVGSRSTRTFHYMEGALKATQIHQESVGRPAMARSMDNMPFTEFYQWLAEPTFTGPVGLIAKLYLKEVTIK